MPPAVDELETRRLFFLPGSFCLEESHSVFSQFFIQRGKKAMLLIKELVLIEELIKHLGAGDV